ncbi:MAG: 23S rRNA (adenine(2030)-N(6))-methyltransferase RlmJ [Steroidobacteraceae bacterium]
MTRYRHSFHAGNFGDVHKHVTLTALLQALARKDKGFLYLETHAGRGSYDLGASGESRASAAGIERVLRSAEHPEITDYAQAIAEWRTRSANPRGYPGSPLIAAKRLRPQDRAVLIELLAEEAGALETALPRPARAQIVQADGFERLRAYLPPAERRGLTFVDPSYEAQGELARAAGAIAEALRRFQTGVIAVWYPIKDARDTRAWHAALRASLPRELLAAELWLHPCDSRVALNGSGVLIVNPPHGIAERMQAWLPALRSLLDPSGAGGTSVRFL